MLADQASRPAGVPPAACPLGSNLLELVVIHLVRVINCFVKRPSNTRIPRSSRDPRAGMFPNCRVIVNEHRSKLHPNITIQFRMFHHNQPATLVSFPSSCHRVVVVLSSSRPRESSMSNTSELVNRGRVWLLLCKYLI
jgi:16S rRNA C1402 N4-methylase RsmH